MSLSLELAERLQALAFQDLPAQAVHATTLSLADALCVMLAAAELEPAAAPFHRHALSGGPGPATLLAGGTAGPSLAALANGALSHALDFEDTYDAVGLHPNAVVIPAALALAEAESASGADLLLAIATGCDITCRIGDALAADPAARGWYHPPMIAAAGAAFGASRLLALTPAQTVSAVSLTLCQFSLTDELKRSPTSDLRAVRDGFAARAVVEACLLARAGVRGVDAPLEGKSGLLAMLSGHGPAGDMPTDFVSAFRGTEVTFKHWPSCRGTHPYIALAMELRDRHIHAGDIASLSLSVRQPDDMLLRPEDDRKRPTTMVGAKFSIPFCFGLAIHRGRVDIEGFEAEARADEAILSMAARVSLDKVIARDSDERPLATIERRDGTRFDVIVPDPPVYRAGSTEFDAMQDKFVDCLRHAGRSAILPDLLRQIRTLDTSDDLAALTACLRAAPPG